MILARRHEQELAEIKALAQQLDWHVQQGLEDLKQLREAYDRSPAEVSGIGPLVAFVHIPKTAGGSVTRMLSAVYSRRGVIKTGNYVRGPERTQNKLGRLGELAAQWSSSRGRAHAIWSPAREQPAAGHAVHHIPPRACRSGPFTLLPAYPPPRNGECGARDTGSGQARELARGGAGREADAPAMQSLHALPLLAPYAR